jgi:phosphosulfolactate synthase (CoM biosynthesis protein A)
MTVKKKVALAVEKFIDKGAKVKAEKGKRFKDILLRMPLPLLEKVDEIVAKKDWGTRTKWIIEAIEYGLDREKI